MIDTRCYNCCKDTDLFHDIEEENYHPDYAIKEYQGKGIFKCPRCGDVLDLSHYTYLTKVSRYYDDNELFSEILEFDPKLNSEGRDAFEQDMLEPDIFEKYPFGTYLFEVHWFYYRCGGYEYPEEYDVKIEILSEENIHA